MSEELQQKLRDQLWEVANKLRGNMSASDFMYFTLGFIFYKYLSEKIEKHANDALVDDEVTFKELWAMEKDEDIEELQEVVKTECLENIGYFIEPNFLFSSVIESIKRKENILPMLERSLKRIEDSTLGQDSEEDFGGLFSDIDLASPKLGKTADDKNTLVSNVLLALDDIDFGVEASQEIDILGDAYEYMISQFAAGAGKKAGEFYTPQEVSRILAEIVTIGHARLRNVYDPTCGSGDTVSGLTHGVHLRFKRLNLRRVGSKKGIGINQRPVFKKNVGGTELCESGPHRNAEIILEPLLGNGTCGNRGRRQTR